MQGSPPRSQGPSFTQPVDQRPFESRAVLQNFPPEYPNGRTHHAPASAYFSQPQPQPRPRDDRLDSYGTTILAPPAFPRGDPSFRMVKSPTRIEFVNSDPLQQQVSRTGMGNDHLFPGMPSPHGDFPGQGSRREPVPGTFRAGNHPLGTSPLGTTNYPAQRDYMPHLTPQGNATSAQSLLTLMHQNQQQVDRVNAATGDNALRHAYENSPNPSRRSPMNNPRESQQSPESSGGRW